MPLWFSTHHGWPNCGQNSSNIQGTSPGYRQHSCAPYFLAELCPFDIEFFLIYLFYLRVTYLVFCHTLVGKNLIKIFVFGLPMKGRP